MKTILKYCLLLCCLWVTNANAQKAKSFFKLTGSWGGELETYENGVKGKPSSIRLAISKSNEPMVYDWIIQYSQEEKDKRHYKLIQTDTTGNNFKLDEGNGIELMMTKTGNTISSTYKAGKVLLTTFYHFKNGFVEMEVYSYNMRDNNNTSDKDGNGITSYPLKAYQHAVLRPIK